MIFPVDVIIEWLSKGLTLEAGDIIATGTPEGVGIGRTPQEFLPERRHRRNRGRRHRRPAKPHCRFVILIVDSL